MGHATQALPDINDFLLALREHVARDVIVGDDLPGTLRPQMKVALRAHSFARSQHLDAHDLGICQCGNLKEDCRVCASNYTHHVSEVRGWDSCITFLNWLPL